MEISDALDLPRATVQERLKRLKHAGVVRKVAAVPDYSKVGRPVTAYVSVTFASGGNVSQRALAEQISVTEGVFEVSVISGSGTSC